MIRKLPRLALLVTSLVLANCSKPEAESQQKPVEIKGQIFIIQKDRVNVKLGGVEIRYIPREAFEKRCLWIEKNSPKAALIASYEKDLEKIDSMIEASGNEKHSGKIHDFLSAAKERQADAWKRLTENPAWDDHRLHWLAVEADRPSFENAGFDTNEEQWKLSALFFKWLADSAVATTQTDADGNYNLDIPSAGEGYLFAQTSRHFDLDKFESYFWIKKVSPSTTGAVHLTSSNCLSPIELKGHLRTSAAAEEPLMDDLVKEYGLRDLSWFSEAVNLLRRIEDNEAKVATLKSQAKTVESEIGKAKYMDVVPE